MGARLGLGSARGKARLAESLEATLRRPECGGPNARGMSLHLTSTAVVLKVQPSDQQHQYRWDLRRRAGGQAHLDLLDQKLQAGPGNLCF